MSLMVTADQKPITGTQKIKEKGIQTKIIGSHVTREGARDEERNRANYESTRKAMKEMAVSA